MEETAAARRSTVMKGLLERIQDKASMRGA